MKQKTSAEIWAGLIFKVIAVCAAVPVLCIAIPIAAPLAVIYWTFSLIKHYVPQSQKMKQQAQAKQQKNAWARDIYKQAFGTKVKENAQAN